jgi:hypothetical protein
VLALLEQYAICAENPQQAEMLEGVHMQFVSHCTVLSLRICQGTLLNLRWNQVLLPLMCNKQLAKRKGLVQHPYSYLLGMAISKAMRPLLDYLTLSISRAIIRRTWTGLYLIHRYSLDFSVCGWFFVEVKAV